MIFAALDDLTRLVTATSSEKAAAPAEKAAAPAEKAVAPTEKAAAPSEEAVAPTEKAAAPTEWDALPTPCDEFTVGTLRRHLFGWFGYFEAAFADPSGDVRPDPADFTGPDDAQLVIGKLTTTLRRALDNGVETATVNVPRLGGAFPGAAVVDLLLIEVLGHGWDLARATGLPWEPAEKTSLHALDVLHTIIKPEYRGPGMPFGPEVEVSPDAPALDRLVAFTGRDPHWKSAS
jgi:uncharacterized protein (TIGR03086 family)